ncbi:MAG: DUF4157 domain-containing protein [Defluviitaleaceae bacterium]|nr:DUF4157 domain-containing protein [Defluviitaleaceae bacterium]
MYEYLNGKEDKSQKLYREKEQISEKPHLLPENKISLPLQCKGLGSNLPNYASSHVPNKINWAEASGYYKKQKKSEPLQGKGLGNNLPKYDSSCVPDKINWAEASGYYKKRKKSEPLQGKGLEIESTDVLESDKSDSSKKLDIPENLSQKIQDSFGIDTSKISLLESPEVAKMGAKATAQGNEIRFAPGEYNPDTTEGLKILGHELNHVREQATGNIQANVEGTNIHFDPVHEASSDRVGEAFASGALSGAVPVDTSSAASVPMQAKMGKKQNKMAKKDITAIMSTALTNRESVTSAIETNSIVPLANVSAQNNDIRGHRIEGIGSEPSIGSRTHEIITDEMDWIPGPTDVGTGTDVLTDENVIPPRFWDRLPRGFRGAIRIVGDAISRFAYAREAIDGVINRESDRDGFVTLGEVAGDMGGAALGAKIGTLFKPGLGTIIGAGLGFGLSRVGRWLGGRGAGQAYDWITGGNNDNSMGQNHEMSSLDLIRQTLREELGREPHSQEFAARVNEMLQGQRLLEGEERTDYLRIMLELQELEAAQLAQEYAAIRDQQYIPTSVNQFPGQLGQQTFTRIEVGETTVTTTIVTSISEMMNTVTEGILQEPRQTWTETAFPDVYRRQYTPENVGNFSREEWSFTSGPIVTNVQVTTRPIGDNDPPQGSVWTQGSSTRLMPTDTDLTPYSGTIPDQWQQWGVHGSEWRQWD